MPLTTRGTNHITALLAKTRKGRTVPVTCVILNPDGTTSTVICNAIFRLMQDADETLDPQGHGQDFKTDDAVMSVLASEISFPQLRATRYVDVGGTSVAAIANRFIITSIQPKGMAVPFNRFVCAMQRQH